MRHVILIAALGLSACASLPGEPFVETLETRDWRFVATEADRARMSEWRTAFTSALAEARADGHDAQIDALGVTGEPDAARVFDAVPTGSYRCRTIKLGTQGRGTLSYVDYPFFDCTIRVEEDLLGFHKLTGSQRPVGLLFPDNDYRRVFLGTLMLGDETRAMRYGADPQRDMIGALQNIGEDRWRLLLPYPAYESTIDIIELVPAGE
ncbi:MAG: DUF4893 domain-containing protein [Sphingomonas sp.]|nr:DUF4893 domain-containing protein [Sphingomonas sp.]RZV49811.1 MAG: DUF4893 domain-containing protein [Sphingomonadaceae bacterium]